MYGAYQIIISRERSILAGGKKYRIEDNGISVGELANGKTIVIPTSEGVHTISFVAFGKEEKSIQVEVSNRYPTINLSATINKVNGKIEISYNNYFQPGVQAGKSKKKRIVPGIILVLFGILLISSVFGNDNKEESNRADTTKTAESQAESQNETVLKNVDPVPEEDPLIEISAHDLWVAYDENEVKADDLYKKKTISVTGTVFEIGKDIVTGTPFIALKAGDSLGIYSIQCFFQDSDEHDKIAAVKDGDKVTITGKCEGKALNVLLRNCSLPD